MENKSVDELELLEEIKDRCFADAKKAGYVGLNVLSGKLLEIAKSINETLWLIQVVEVQKELKKEVKNEKI